MDNQQFVAFLADVKNRAQGFVNEDYISEDVRKCLRDFLKVVDAFAALQTDSVSVGADARLFKKRLDQSKLELKAAEKRIELLKSAGLALVIPTKQLTNEIASVSDAAVQQKMKASIQKIAEALIEISKI